MTPQEEKKDGILNTIQKKMTKNYGRKDILRCTPVIWHEISRIKSRVEEVIAKLSNKRVRDEKLLEFKK